MGLRATNLAVSRGGMRLLDGVGFEIPDGTALTVRGPNGVGKTSLLRALAGLQPFDDGKVSCTPDHIAYAGHGDAVKPALTVGENLRFWAGVFGCPSIEPALAAFDLAPLVDRQAAELSAGQRRRLGLARLLLTGRKVWAMDEPTVALDKNSVGLFADCIGAHLQQGGIAIIATHIDLRLETETLDLAQFRARPDQTPTGAFDEAFL